MNYDNVVLLKQRIESSGFYLQIGMASSAKYYDFQIARTLQMAFKEYQEIMIKEFNAIKINGQIYFNDKKDCERAKEWMESILVAIELQGA